MEWVETTGRSIEEAKDAALDQLGVDEQDAEFEVVEEPKTGLFGRLRSEARVRARVRPTRPRAKEERRDRRRRGTRSSETEQSEARDRGEEANEPSGGSYPRGPVHAEHSGEAEDRSEETIAAASLTERGEVARSFLEGLVARFGYSATVALQTLDEETIQLDIAGDDLGLLIGTKGQTLSALQELARTVVQRQASGRNGRVLVDVSGYRHKRRLALERFARQVASEVLLSGRAKVMEPMHPADRKVVHDTVNAIEGVTTASEGEDPRRRVVIIPATLRHD